MTQIARYAHYLHVPIKSVKGSISLTITAAGSILAQTIEAGGEGVETNFQIESDADPEKLRMVLKNARNGCYARQMVAKPVPFKDTMTVNGQTYEV